MPTLIMMQSADRCHDDRLVFLCVLRLAVKNREERGDVRAFGFSSIFRPPRRPVALTPASYLYVKYKYTSTVSK